MSNLQRFKNFELNESETFQIRGSGWKDILVDIFVTEVWEWSKENLFSREAQVRYGRRMFETGSPGGHK